MGGTGAKPLKKHSYRHDLIIQYAAMGLRQKDIAARLGMTQSRLSIVLSNATIQAKIRESRREIFAAAEQELSATNPDKALQQMLPDGLKVIRDIIGPMSNSTDKTRLEAAFRLLDRTHGRPVQKTEITGGIAIRDLFEALEQKAYQKPMKELIIEADYDTSEIEDTEVQDSTEVQDDGEAVEAGEAVGSYDSDALVDEDDGEAVVTELLGESFGFQVGKEQESES